MSWRSRRRALVLLAIVLDVPVAAPAVRRLTGEPRAEQTELGGVPVELVRPAGTGPWPAWLFVNGAHPLRREEPVVHLLSRGLARAGYLVVVPDVPGLGEGTITARTLEATAAVTEAATELPDVAGGRIALIGASTGAALALLTAGRPDLCDRISVVAAVAPFADLERMVCLATTRGYAENGTFMRYEVTDLHRRVVARSLVAALADGDERARLLSALDAAEAEGRDHVHVLDHADQTLTPEARAVVDVLLNDEPERFRAVYDALPADLLALFAALSPLGAAAGVTAPVEVVVPPSDVYFPLGEAHALAAALPNAYLTVTGTLDHTRPQLGLGRLRDLRTFDRFVVRGLSAAG
jgi:pimeloyl-ACP methyl ester carboxylesterase